MHRWLWGMWLSIALASASARAQDVVEETDASIEDRRRAAVLLDRSAIAYFEERYLAAAALLEEAYLLEQEPVLLYNLGRAYEGAGEGGRALAAYGRYLQAAPEAENAATVREWVARLRAEEDARVEAERARTEAERVAREEDRARDARLRESLERASARHEERAAAIEPWIATGAGGVLFVTGLALGAGALARHDDAREADRQVDADAAEADAVGLGAAGSAMLVAGAALAASGIAWVVAVRTEPSVGPEVEPDVGAHAEPDVEVAIGAGSIALGARF